MKTINFLVLFSLFFYSCGPSALQYNDKLIGPQREIAAHLDTIFNPNSSYSTIQQQRLELVRQAEATLSSIRNLPDFKENSSYKQAAVKYYSFVANYFDSTLDIDSLLYKYSSKDRIPTINEIQFQQTNKNFQHFQELENELKKEQEKFAKEFGLNL